MKLDIDKTLNLSTAHITEQDNTLLLDVLENGHPDAGWVIPLEDYGFMVFVPEGNPEEVEQHVHGFKRVGMSEAFVNIYRLTAEQGCTWMRLDCDIPVVPELQQFDW